MKYVRCTLLLLTAAMAYTADLPRGQWIFNMPKLFLPDLYAGQPWWNCYAFNPDGPGLVPATCTDPQPPDPQI